MFVKADAVIACLKSQDISIAAYIDGWLLKASSESLAKMHSKMIMDHLINLGFAIKLQKEHSGTNTEHLLHIHFDRGGAKHGRFYTLAILVDDFYTQS